MADLNLVKRIRASALAEQLAPNELTLLYAKLMSRCATDMTFLSFLLAYFNRSKVMAMDDVISIISKIILARKEENKRYDDKKGIHKLDPSLIGNIASYLFQKLWQIVNNEQGHFYRMQLSKQVGTN